MTLLASIAISVAGRAPSRRFDQATRAPEEAQRNKLLAILRRNQDTEFGREHRFAALHSLADYAAAVPVNTYENLAERIERMARGEKNVLTAEDPVMFARTSGTTGKPKLVPITKTCQGRDHQDQTRTWLYHAKRDHPTLLRGLSLSLVSPAVEGHTEAGIPYGSTSGHIYQNFPGLIQRSYAIPYEVFEIDDYDAKYYVLMRLGLCSDVTFLCTANPSSIVKLCEVAEENAEALLKDITDGTLRQDLEMPDKVRELVQARLRPEPEIARKLGRVRQRRDGRLLPADYWPNLALIGCWKGGTVSSYVDRFPEWFSPDGAQPMAVRDWGYLSSEARGSIPLTDEGSGGVLAVRTNVYEFVDAAEVDAAPESRQSWNFLGTGELEVGKDYYIFITTTGGLYRYHIDDVVGVESLYHETPVIVFKRKGRDVTSITGEKVSANQVLQAVAAAGKETGVQIDHFKVEADPEAAAYVFKVESAKDIPEGKRKPLLESLERNLCELNLEYAGKRKSQRLNPATLHVMKPGWYDKEKRSQVKQGLRQFQWKPNVLSMREPVGQEQKTGGNKPAEEHKEAARNGAGHAKTPVVADGDRELLIAEVTQTAAGS